MFSQQVHQGRLQGFGAWTWESQSCGQVGACTAASTTMASHVRVNHGTGAQSGVAAPGDGLRNWWVLAPLAESWGGFVVFQWELSILIFKENYAIDLVVCGEGCAKS